MDKIVKNYKHLTDLKPRGFWPGFLAGVFYFSYIFWWFWSVHHLASLGIESGFFAFLIIFIPFVLTVGVMSLFWGLFGYISLKLSRHLSVSVLPLYLAGFFVLTEYARAWAFGILWFGKSSLFGPHWTLGNPAYLFADLGVIRQSASWWGIYGVDFVLVFLAVAVFMLVRSWRKRAKGGGLVLQIILTAALLTTAGIFQTGLKQEGKQLIVSVIQTKIPVKDFYEPSELLDDFGNKVELLKEASKNSDVVIFPENADFSKTLSGFLDSASAQRFFNNLSQKSVLIIDGNRVPEGEGVRSKTIFIDSQKGAADFYDKKLLTPGGESLPYIAYLPLAAFERLSGKNFVSSRAIYIGGTEDNVLGHDSGNFKIAACSDIISPNLTRGEDFGLIINANNLAVFNGNRRIAGQLLAIARYRAAENSKYLVVSSNYGLSYVIDPLGNIAKTADSTGYQILTGEVVLNQTRTWYNKLGDWPILLLSLVILGLGLIKLRNADQNKNFC